MGDRGKDSMGPVDEQLMENLRRLRLTIANERGVPAFTIFHDSSLVDMCRKLPTSTVDFLSVSGVGKVKMEQYGDRFVEAIADYLNGNKPQAS